MSQHSRNSVTRLDEDGWVELYDPAIPRKDWTDQADGALEFEQGPSSAAYYYENYGWTNVITDITEINRRQIEKQPYVDPNFPWEV